MGRAPSGTAAGRPKQHSRPHFGASFGVFWHPFGLPLALLFCTLFFHAFRGAFWARPGCPGRPRRQHGEPSGTVVKPPFGSNNGGFTVGFCIFSPYVFSWAGKRGIKGVTIQVWQPRRCQNVMATLDQGDNSGKTEVAPAMCGETRIRPVGRTASMAKYGASGADTPVWQVLRTVPRRIYMSFAQTAAALVVASRCAKDEYKSNRKTPFTI